MLDCPVLGRCGGCPLGALSIETQREQKRAALKLALAAAGQSEGLADGAPIHDVGVDRFRERLDVALRRTNGAVHLGFHGLGTEGFVAVESCPLATEPLQAFFRELVADRPPLERASLRLRCSPSGMKGLWIDAANAELRALLDEAEWLGRRLAAGVRVELGQRRKPVIRGENGVLRLQKHAVFEGWLETVGPNGPIPLRLPVGGFSQTGQRANAALVGAVLTAVGDASTVLEVGAGSGNFTLALASRGVRVRAAEPDLLARLGLKAAIAEQQLAPVELVLLDLEAGAALEESWFAGVDAVLADPPRSGLGRLPARLSALPPALLPRRFVHISCAIEPVGADLLALGALGYRVVAVAGVDQFPHTAECEWVFTLERT